MSEIYPRPASVEHAEADEPEPSLSQRHHDAIVATEAARDRRDAQKRRLDEAQSEYEAALVVEEDIANQLATELQERRRLFL